MPPVFPVLLPSQAWLLIWYGKGMDGHGDLLAYRPNRYMYYMAVVPSRGNAQIESFSQHGRMSAQYFLPRDIPSLAIPRIT